MAISTHIVEQSQTNIDEGLFYSASDGCRLFIYDYRPAASYHASIFVISGITGINHHNEKDVIQLLANHENRVVVIHPRGTGYSEGIRGDISDIQLVIDDYKKIITSDRDYIFNQHPFFLFGHSMSCAVLLAIAHELKNIDGAILVNPPYKQKKTKGVSPDFGQYIKYAFYMLFAKHKPIVNMAGNPSVIESAEDRTESEQRQKDPLLVKYFSMFYMNEVKKILHSMPDYAKQAEYPLLLIYGSKDSIVDKAGCDLIYKHWKNANKTYKIIENGTHGKSTVIKAKDIITQWIKGKKGECEPGNKAKI
jgi:alpha-beta hydrolase superfamily lysophospholipase